MLRFAVILISTLAVTAALAFFTRHLWVSDKIAALTAPSSSAYKSANLSVPPKGTRPRIVLIGDSRIAQWPMQNWPQGWEVINRGIGGETTAQLRQRFYSDALELSPDVIVVEAGINDIIAASFLSRDNQLKIVRDVQSALQSLVDAGKNTASKIIIATIIPSGRPAFFRLPVWRSEVVTLTRETNTRLKGIEFPSGTLAIDLALTVETPETGMIADRFRADTLHLNELGYQRLSSKLRPMIESLVANH